MRGSSPRMMVPNPVAPKKKKRLREQRDATCPDLAAKIFRFSAPPNHRHIYRRLVLSKRGGSRSSRTLGAGCGGRGWRAGRGALTRTVKSCGPDAPTLASSWRKFFSQAMVANKPGHQGEREGTR